MFHTRTDNADQSLSQVALCPACGEPYTLRDTICKGCGSDLASDYTTIPVLPSLKLDDANILNNPNGHLTHPHKIVLMVDGRPIALPDQMQIIVGRVTPGGGPQPDVDLTAFDAAHRGVSRQHVQIKNVRFLTYVADLRSRNGTWLNNVSIAGAGERLLRDRDELRLGDLHLTIQFR